jgi:hypothetical protein
LVAIGISWNFEMNRRRLAFVVEWSRKRGGAAVFSREWSKQFWGRASGREAFDALAKFVRGESVTFPVQVHLDGFTGRGG